MKSIGEISEMFEKVCQSKVDMNIFFEGKKNLDSLAPLAEMAKTSLRFSSKHESNKKKISPLNINLINKSTRNMNHISPTSLGYKILPVSPSHSLIKEEYSIKSNTHHVSIKEMQSNIEYEKLRNTRAEMARYKKIISLEKKWSDIINFFNSFIKETNKRTEDIKNKELKSNVFETFTDSHFDYLKKDIKLQQSKFSIQSKYIKPSFKPKNRITIKKKI